MSSFYFVVSFRVGLEATVQAEMVKALLLSTEYRTRFASQ